MNDRIDNLIARSRKFRYERRIRKIIEEELDDDDVRHVIWNEDSDECREISPGSSGDGRIIRKHIMDTDQ
jgi:hypothetical protein